MSEADIADWSECRRLGIGDHALVVFTFPRMISAARDEVCCICLAFGPLWQKHYDRVVSSAAVLSGLDRTGLLEPLKVLGIISCNNGPALHSRLAADISGDDTIASIGPHWLWFRANPESLLSQIESTLERDLPEFLPRPREDDGGLIQLKLPEHVRDSLPDELFLPTSHEYRLSIDPSYSPDDGRPDGSTRWQSNLASRIRRGEQILDESPQRIAIVETGLSSVSKGLVYGALGWTRPEFGLFKKKGLPNQFWVSIELDDGSRHDVNVWWIDFVVDDNHEREIRNVARDRAVRRQEETNPHTNQRVVVEDDLSNCGFGVFEVYGYTLEFCLKEVNQGCNPHVPTKIGFTQTTNGAVCRVRQQMSTTFENAHLLFVGRCEDGRGTEAAIHRELAKTGRKVCNSPGDEWYMTNPTELRELFTKVADS